MPVGSTSNAGKTGRGPIIEVKNLRKEYPVLDETVVALERVNLAIPQGQICCIYGESGSGKSTLLNQLAGMEKPTKGGVRITGVPISRLDERQLAEFRQKHLGFVFQSYNLLSNLNAIENVAMPLMFRGVPKRKRETIARAMLKRVGLGKRMNHYPTQMSGGQQQRVGIARAFVTRPQVVFADEPTGNLDERNEKIVLDLFRQLHEQGTTIIVVTHDALVASCAQREIMLNHGVLVGEQWNDEEAKRAYEAAGGKPAFTGSAAEGAQNGGIAISFADPTKAAKTGDTDAANVAVAAGVADDTDVEPDVTKGEQA